MRTEILLVVLTIVLPSFTLSQNWQRLSSPKRISVQMCDQYKEEVFDASQSLIMGILPGPERKPNYVVKAYKCNSSISLIVGGSEAESAEFPHMAAIGWKDQRGAVSFKCGGSLISNKFVLTVAHCTYVDSVQPNIVRLGDLNLARDDDVAGPVDYGIKKILIHEQYDFQKRNDIALLELEEIVKFSRFIRPACLSQEANYNSEVIATGWGQNSTYGSTTDHLMKVSLNVVDVESCNAAGLKISHLGQMCVKGKGNKDTCNGDSGAPIQVSHRDILCVYDIIGLTSYGGIRCGGNVSLAVYTRVHKYIDWIETRVWGDNR